jgi:hypothetical protein
MPTMAPVVVPMLVAIIVPAAIPAIRVQTAAVPAGPALAGSVRAAGSGAVAVVVVAAVARV